MVWNCVGKIVLSMLYIIVHTDKNDVVNKYFLYISSKFLSGYAYVAQFKHMIETWIKKRGSETPL